MILLQALAKEPKQRYQSAEQFADDIRRHLDSMPVMAHQPRLSYRLRKLVARNAAGFTVVRWSPLCSWRELYPL